MNSAATNVWMWILLSVLGVAAVVLSVIFLIEPLETWFVSLVIAAFVLWGVLSRVRRSVPLSQCPACGYSLEGLPGPVCPECGRASDEVRAKSLGPRGTRRIIEAACLAFCIASVIIIASWSIRSTVWQSVSDYLGWPHEFEVVNREFAYQLGTFGPAEGASEDAPLVWNETDELFRISVRSNGYLNQIQPGQNHTASVHALWGVPSVPLPPPYKGLLIPGPGWEGELEIVSQANAGTDVFGELHFKSVSELDVDSLVDVVLDARSEHPVGVDARLSALFSDPAVRTELKESLAVAWASGLSTQSNVLTSSSLGSMGYESDSERAQRGSLSLRGGFGGGSSSGGSKLGPAATTGMWVSLALCWLLAVFVAAVLMCFYGDPT